MNFLPVKGEGRTVMTSDFVNVLDGIVRYSDKAWEAIKNDPIVAEEIKLVGEERARRAGVILDVSKDGYYTTEKCIPDFVKVGIREGLKTIWEVILTTNVQNCGKRP